MMGWNGANAGWMAVLMVVAWLVLIAVAAWAVVALTRGRRRPDAPPAAGESPAQLLDRRLAAGELTPEEYLALRSALEVYPAAPGRDR